MQMPGSYVCVLLVTGSDLELVLTVGFRFKGTTGERSFSQGPTLA